MVNEKGAKMVKNILSSMLMIVSLSVMPVYATADSGNASENADGSRTLHHHVPAQVYKAHKLHHHHSASALDLRITLAVNNEAELDTLIESIKDPKSPNYHHYLTPDQFTQQFGASDIDIKQVKHYLRAHGLWVTGQSPNGLVLNVSGTVSDIEKAFGVNIFDYQNSDGTVFFSTDTDPTIPAEIVTKITSVGGLENVVKLKSHAQMISNPLGAQLSQNGATTSQPQVVTPKYGTGWNGYLAPKDIYKAYNLNTLPLISSSRQNVTLFELDGYLQSDITAYESAFGLSHVPLQNVLIDGFSGNPTIAKDSVEVTVDTELVEAFAPTSSKILVYEASNTLQGWEDEWTRIANDKDQYGNLVNTVVSCSWALAEDEAGPYAQFDKILFQQMAAQGQAVFVASGDWTAYNGQSSLSVNEPSSEPYVTSVGISVLNFNNDGTFGSETGSSISGGGVSSLYTIPSYQQGMISANSKGSTSMRNLPDVALTADPSTAYALYVAGSWSGWCGSSLASPIWASFISRVNQARAIAGKPILGFVNPSLYQIAKSANYASDFHDITSGNNGYYPAVAGYDLVTGLGSFNGANLYNDLAGYNATLPSVPTGLSAVVSLGKVQLSWNSSPGSNIKYNVKRSTNIAGPYTNITILGGIAQTSFADTSTSPYIVYYYVVSVVNSVGESLNSLPIGGYITSVPSVPSGLVAIPDNTEVGLSWNNSVGASYYNIKRSTSLTGSYANIATTSYNYYLDKNLTNGTTYYYVVSAVNSLGESVNSLQVKGAPFLPLPSQPQIYSAVIGKDSTNGKTMVTLNWGVSNFAATYNIKKSTVIDGTYSTIGSTSATSFKDESSFTAGTTYYYEVSSVNASGEGVNSYPSNVTFVAPAPSLSANPGVNNVLLSWNSTPGVINIKRSGNSGGPYSLVVSGYINGSYLDTSAITGKTYYYVVSLTNAGGESPNSNEVKAVPIVAPSLPAPSGLFANGSNTMVTLGWNAVAGASSYSVKRSTSKTGLYAFVQTITSNSFIDSNLVNGTTYYYIVTTWVNINGISYPGPDSAPISATPTNQTIPPAPTGLLASVVNNQIVLSWSASSASVNYNVKRSTVSGGPFNSSSVLVSGLKGNSFIDSSVTNGATYYYVVSAVNAVGEGPNSNQLTVLVKLQQAAPTGLKAVVNNGTITLSWNYLAGDSYYLVKRSTSVSGPFVVFSQTNGNQVTDPALQPNTTYYYTVSSYSYLNGDNIPSPNATPVSAFATFLAPTLSVVLNNNQPSLTWTNCPWAIYYKVSARSPNVGGGFPYTLTNGITVTNFIDTTAVQSGATYYYTISAISAGNVVLNSNEVSVTLPTPPPPSSPTGVKAVSSKGSVALSWNPVSGSVFYWVKKSKISGGPYTYYWGTVAAQFTDTNVTSGVPYYYVISTYYWKGNNLTESPNSIQVTGNP